METKCMRRDCAIAILSYLQMGSSRVNRHLAQTLSQSSLRSKDKSLSHLQQ